MLESRAVISVMGLRWVVYRGLASLDEAPRIVRTSRYRPRRPLARVTCKRTRRWEWTLLLLSGAGAWVPRCGFGPMGPKQKKRAQSEERPKSLGLSSGEWRYSGPHEPPTLIRPLRLAPSLPTLERADNLAVHLKEAVP